jgi:hypothetical protein
VPNEHLPQPIALLVKTSSAQAHDPEGPQEPQLRDDGSSTSSGGLMIWEMENG